MHKYIEALVNYITPCRRLGSSEATVFGMKVFGIDHDAFWFKPVRLLYRGFTNIHNAKQWILYRMTHRYHVLNLGITPGWYDTDYRMFHACFALLGQFVEQELGRMSPDEAKAAYGYTADECHYKGYRLHSCGGHDEQAIDLWLWYKIELPAEERAVDAEILELYGNAKFKFTSTLVDEPGLSEAAAPIPKRTAKYEHDYIENLMDDKLRQLIELRRCLWT
jgi:hypothetical protein